MPVRSTNEWTAAVPDANLRKPESYNLAPRGYLRASGVTTRNKQRECNVLLFSDFDGNATHQAFTKTVLSSSEPVRKGVRFPAVLILGHELRRHSSVLKA